MEAKRQVLQRAALSGALDALPLDALQLYLLLLARVKEVGRESCVGLQTIQHALGKGFSHADCLQAFGALAAHRLLTWTPALSRASRSQQAKGGREGLEVTFRLNPLRE